MDNSLGKHATYLAACLTAAVVLVLSPGRIRAEEDDSQVADSTVELTQPAEFLAAVDDADESDDSQAVDHTADLTQHAEVLPAVDVPAEAVDSRAVEFAQQAEALPAVDLPAAELEGMVELPAGEFPSEIPLHVLPVEEDAIGTGLGEGLIADGVESFDSAIGTPSWCDAGPAPVFSTGSWFSAGRWYTQLDAVVLTKDARSKRFIAADSSGVIVPGEANIMGTASEKFDYQLGTRATIGRFLGRDAANRDHLWEFSYFGAFDWRAQSELGGTSSIQTALTIGNRLFRAGGLNAADPYPGFNNNDLQTYRYESDLNSFELNYRIKTRPGRDQMALHPSGIWTRHTSSGQIRSFLAGMRAMSIDEGFRNEAFTGDFLTGLYRVRTGNDLFGPQIGIEAIELKEGWHLGFRGYLGMLANFADRRSFLFSEVDGQVINERVQKLTENRLTLLTQFGAYGAYHLRPNLTIRAGYDFMYMSGLGVAIDNLLLGDTFPAFDTNGVSLYHGLSLGFEQTW